jgi:hypothetical protein
VRSVRQGMRMVVAVVLAARPVAAAMVLVVLAARPVDAGPAFAGSENNVKGAMPSPIVGLGVMSSTGECVQAAYAQPTATSWTYHHCSFPPAGSGNYSCRCYIRTDGRWLNASEALVDSGDILGRGPRGPPLPPPVASRARCTDALSCGLNGECDTATGICACEPPWTGPTCSVLDLLPTLPGSGLHVFDRVSGLPTSTWGGSVVGDDKGGYLMFAAEMLGNCGIGAWRTNSRVVLARAQSAVGPYTFVREIFPAFAHEPTVGRGPHGEYVVWFTRYKHLNSTSPCLGVCVDGSTLDECKRAQVPGQPAPFTEENPATSWMAWAIDPIDGEWSAPVMVYNGTDGSNGRVPTSDTNLAPVIYPNGSLVGLWRGVYPAIPQVQPAGMGIYTVRATNWKDPTTYDFGHASLHNSIMGPDLPAPNGGVYLDEEDPQVWLDSQGRLHAVVHMFRLGGHLASADGGHSWRWFGPVTCGVREPCGNSTNAQNWHRSIWPAIDGAKQCLPMAGVDGGASGTMELCPGRRERPHLIFDSSGRPLAVSNGITLPGGGDYCWTVTQPTTLWKPRM